MSIDVKPVRDRLGRVYTPAVGRRLRPLLWISLIGFAILFANGFYLSSVKALTWYLGTTQQTYFYYLMVVLHLLLGFLLIVPFLIFGFAHLATAWNRPNKTAVRFGLALLAVALVVLISGLVLVRLGRLRGDRSSDPRPRLLAARAGAALGHRALRAAPARRTAHPLGMGATACRGRGRVRAYHGNFAFSGSAVLRREGPQGRQAVLLSVRGRDQNRQVHPGAHAHDGRLLPQMPPGRLCRLVSLGASSELVQQRGLPRQRARNSAGFTRGRRLDAGSALVCRLP